MRNLSFALTTAQVRAQTRTVTRRRGTWWAQVLKPGDLLCAVALLTPVAWLGVGFLLGALWMRAGGWSALLTGGRS